MGSLSHKNVNEALAFCSRTPPNPPPKKKAFFSKRGCSQWYRPYNINKRRPVLWVLDKLDQWYTCTWTISFSCLSFSSFCHIFACISISLSLTRLDWRRKTLIRITLQRKHDVEAATTAIEEKTSLKNNHLCKRNYFVIIPCCLHFVLLTNYATSGVVGTTLNQI